MDTHICAAASVGLQQLRSAPPLVGTHWFYYDPTREYDEDDDELLKAESGIEFDLHDHIQPPEPVENQQFIPSEDVQPPKCLWQILDLSKAPKKRVTKSRSQLIPKPQGVAVQVKNEEHASSEVVYPKPPLERYPLIWSESRQEICETLDWFRSYQGGVYFSKDIAKGYLLSAFSAERDIFHHGGRLVISHGGGKADSIHSINGKSQFQEASDQTSNDKSVRSLLNTMTLQLPIVLLIDDKYRLFPFDLSSKGCTYAVLGFYRIAYAWAEKQPNPNNGTAIVKYKFAFQWCSEQGDPWWFSPSYSNTALPTAVIKQYVLNPELTHLFIRPGKICNVCNTSSPQTYAEGWMCLASSCARFWCMGDTFAPLGLSYDEEFLKPVQFAIEGVPDIRPVHPTLFAKEDDITTTSQFCKGWHCLTCGRLSCRLYKWEHWQCQNCDAIVTVEGRLRNANEFRNQTQGVRFLRHRTSEYSGIITPMSQQYQHEKGFAGYTTFILPCNRGRIHVIYSSPLGNAEADAILQKYQDQARTGHLRFRRWPLRAHKCRGTLLTNYFSQNTGEPYQYVGGAENTVPFTEDSAATDALRLIEKRMLQAINPPISANFNEVLSAAYMDKQKMAYHSDAERGLGPVVASLSLGASAYMHFRLHSQYSNEVPNPSARIVLSLFLRHGDIMVMEGANVQKYYEHTVVPLNFRFAATARSIDSDRHY
ncbi:hypothetical protein C8Q75DRAFT_828746 [Abortiporus biennis]|nr:hypothetical protein C8Q75DRAFT_828746 [Abortiporus biennis]